MWSRQPPVRHLQAEGRPLGYPRKGGHLLCISSRRHGLFTRGVYQRVLLGLGHHCLLWLRRRGDAPPDHHRLLWSRRCDDAPPHRNTALQAPRQSTTIPTIQPRANVGSMTRGTAAKAARPSSALCSNVRGGEAVETFADEVCRNRGGGGADLLETPVARRAGLNLLPATGGGRQRSLIRRRAALRSPEYDNPGSRRLGYLGGCLLMRLHLQAHGGGRRPWA